MTIDLVRDALLWCFVINMGLLLWWLLFFILAHDWMYQFHGKWFKLSVANFDTIHYTGMSKLYYRDTRSRSDLMHKSLIDNDFMFMPFL